MQVVVRQVEGHKLEVRTPNSAVLVDGQDGTANAFRSVELLLGALGSCMIGTMLTEAERQNIDVSDVEVRLRPVVTMAPERVSRIRMTMSLTGELTSDQVEMLSRAAESCKVHNSLHNGVATNLEIVSRAPGAVH